MSPCSALALGWRQGPAVELHRWDPVVLYANWGEIMSSAFVACISSRSHPVVRSGSSNREAVVWLLTSASYSQHIIARSAWLRAIAQWFICLRANGLPRPATSRGQRRKRPSMTASPCEHEVESIRRCRHATSGRIFPNSLVKASGLGPWYWCGMCSRCTPAGIAEVGSSATDANQRPSASLVCCCKSAPVACPEQVHECGGGMIGSAIRFDGHATDHPSFVGLRNVVHCRWSDRAEGKVRRGGDLIR